MSSSLDVFWVDTPFQESSFFVLYNLLMEMPNPFYCLDFLFVFRQFDSEKLLGLASADILQQQVL